MSGEHCFSDEGAPTDAKEDALSEPPAVALARQIESAPRQAPSGANAWALAGRLSALPADLPHHGTFLHAVLETVPMAIAIVAVPGFELLLANRRFHEALVEPLQSTDAVGSRLGDLISPQLVPDAVSLFQKAMTTGEAVTTTERLRVHPARGATCWRLSISPVRDQAGDVAALVVAAEDTTAQVRSRIEADDLAERLRATNEQLTLANLRLQTIIGRLPQGVIVLDQEARIVIANSAAERLLGTTLPAGVKLYSLPVIRLKPNGVPYSLDELPLVRSLRGQTCYGVEIWVKQPGGQVVHTLCSSAPVHDAAGQIAAAVAIFHDITELRELDRLKDEFLSIASHELKNPLTVLKGYVQILLRDSLGPSGSREMRILAIINQEVNRLSRLINLMLDVSRIQLGGLRLDRQPMDLVELARKLLDHFQGVSRRHHLILQAEAERVEGRWDVTRIEQALANLIDNAVKYSPEGGSVTVSIHVAGDRVEVAVQDQGVGVPPDEQDRVFDKFYRAQARASAHAAGLGLGLYVCQEIIRAHGGRMWLESEHGRGSTFYFSLPLDS